MIFLLAMVGPIVLCMSPVENTNDVDNTSSTQSNNPLYFIILLIAMSVILIGQGDVSIDAHILITPIFIPGHIAYYRNLTLPDVLNKLRYRF